MQFTTVALAALAMLTGVDAQTVHAVRVGQNGTVFSPNKITAREGDMVQFIFLGGNHTVTQGPFDHPCQPVSAFNSTAVGVHSGFVPYAASAAMGETPVYTIRVNNTQPIWIYCAQAAHCKNGMSMVINQPTNPAKSLEAYKKAASQITGAAGVPGGATGGQTGATPGTAPGTTPSTPGTGAGGSAPAPSGAPGSTTVPVPAAAGNMAVPTFGMLAAAAFSFLL